MLRMKAHRTDLRYIEKKENGLSLQNNGVSYYHYTIKPCCNFRFQQTSLTTLYEMRKTDVVSKNAIVCG